MKSKWILGIVIAFIVGVLLAWSPIHLNRAAAQTSSVNNSQSSTPALQKPGISSSMNMAKMMSQAFVEVSQKVTPSIVVIVNEEKLQSRLGNDQNQQFDDDLFRRFFGSPHNRDEIQKTLGSGVITSADGYIVTNNHVVDNSTKLMVTLPDGKRVPAKIIGTDPKTDLALIKVEARNLQPISFGKYTDIQVGEWVLALGSPFGETLQHTVTAGIISAKGRSNVGIADYEDFLQTDAAINPGNSGGALVDLDGNLIGINTAIFSASGANAGVGFAIPINMVESVMNQLKQNGRVIRGFLGVTIQGVSPEMMKSLNLNNSEGAVISEVEKGSPAEQAGLKPYDVIVSVNGRRAQNNSEVRDMIATLKPGTEAQIGVIRDGRERTLDVRIGEMQNDQNDRGSNNNEREEKLGKLGLEMQNLTPSLARQLGTDRKVGVVVTEIAPNSTGEEAGLQRGDIIFELNRHPVSSVREFQNAINQIKDSDVLLAVERQGNSFFVTLPLS